MSALSCKRVQSLLSPYLDRELPADLSRAMSLHLAVCDECRVHRDELEALSAVVAGLPREHPAPGLADRVRAGRTRTAWPNRVAAAAAVLLAVGGAYLLGRGHARVEPGAPLARGLQPVERSIEQPLQPGVGTAPRLVAAQDQPEQGLDERPLPEDATALRAARSLFADLELLDEVPADLHEPMLRPQVEHYDLARWAEHRGSDPTLTTVADLVRRLDQSLEGGLAPDELSGLRLAARAEPWDSLGIRQAPGAFAPARLHDLLDRHAAHLPEATRRSLDGWMRFKDDWIRGSGDMQLLSGLIDELAPTLPGHAAAEFTLPDLGDLYERIEWSDEGDGVRRGYLEVERRTEDGASTLRVELRSSSTWRR